MDRLVQRLLYTDLCWALTRTIRPEQHQKKRDETPSESNNVKLNTHFINSSHTCVSLISMLRPLWNHVLVPCVSMVALSTFECECGGPAKGSIQTHAVSLTIFFNSCHLKMNSTTFFIWNLCIDVCQNA